MWESTKDILGFSSHDILIIFLCMMAGLIGAATHIMLHVVRAKRKNEPLDGFKPLLAGYAFVGTILGLCVGFLAATILKETPAATRTIIAISLCIGWQAHRWFEKAGNYALT